MAAAPDFQARTMLASPLTVIAGGNVQSLNRPGVFSVPDIDGFELNHTVGMMSRRLGLDADRSSTHRPTCRCSKCRREKRQTWSS